MPIKVLLIPVEKSVDIKHTSGKIPDSVSAISDDMI